MCDVDPSIHNIDIDGATGVARGIVILVEVCVAPESRILNSERGCLGDALKAPCRIRSMNKVCQ
jgi:hypothetical protein